MKPVVILNLITDALSGRPKSRLPRVDSNAPISQRQTKREIGLAISTIVVVLALILAVVVSFWAAGP